MKKRDYNLVWKRGVNYLKWGYANYIGISLTMANSIMLIKGFFFTEVPIWIIGPAILAVIIPITASIGKWDYKKGTFPELQKISSKNSPPTIDSFRALYVILKSLPDSEEKGEAMEALDYYLQTEKKPKNVKVVLKKEYGKGQFTLGAQNQGMGMSCFNPNSRSPLPKGRG
jgi:hypothetical protein